MKGVEILTSYEVVTEYAFGWKAFWLVFVIAFIIGVIIYNCNKHNKPSLTELFGFSIIGMIIAGYIGGLCGMVTETPIEYETRYKVILSDEVSMNEFADKYEIIEQDGKLFTIREKRQGE